MRGLVVLGSTGSIGTQTLDVVRHFPDEFRVVGLACWNNLEMLAQQVREFGPRYVYLQDSTGSGRKGAFEGCPTITMEEMVSLPEVELVMVATTGKAGLGPTLAAIEAGKTVALANKEVIVMAGELVTSLARHKGTPLLPVDSEPSAIWQCLRGEDKEISRLIITASGGAFRGRTPEELEKVTPAEALRHPTWQMGKKITVDSATLMNKAFEVVENHWLFGVPWEKIHVVIHPQSIVHSMVEFADGSIKAQLGPPDMRLPIQYALFYPRRVPNAVLPRLNLDTALNLSFQPLVQEQYPCFPMALDACHEGATYPAVLNAADEVAVDLFLKGKIGFRDIQRCVQRVLDEHRPPRQVGLGEILEADAWARERALDPALH